MAPQVYRIGLGITNCFLIRDEGTILIDAGPPGQAGRFGKAMARIPVDPADISLILISHAHWDHFGTANEIRDISRAKLAANRREATWLEAGAKRLPPATGPWGTVLMTGLRLISPLISVSEVAVDMALDDEDFPLQPYGIGGRVLHTPGHTAGSVSVLLDSGDAFCGDLAMNRLPLRIGPGMPPVGDSPAVIRQNWRKLLDAGARRIHPSHGKPFDAAVLEEALGKV
jgi:hydroxyacylglutathione hydrolase